MLVITTGFLAVYLLKSWQWALYVSLAAGVTGIVSPRLSRKIEWGWMKLGKLLSYVVPNILLTLIFYLVLFPVALLSRIGRKDPLMLSRDHESYFIEVDREIEPEEFEKIW